MIGTETRIFQRFGRVAIPDGTINGRASRAKIEDEIIARHFPLVTDKAKLVIVWIGTKMSMRPRGFEGPPILIETKEFHPRVC